MLCLSNYTLNNRGSVYLLPKPNKSYQDHFFGRHHWALKIRQTLAIILCWLVFFIPITITVSTYCAYLSKGKHGRFFWYYREGFQELNFLIIFLLFALGMIAVFCLAMGYVQKQRLRGLLGIWPLFDIPDNQKKRQRADNFMTARFGSRHDRQRVKYYVVKPEQNFSKNQLQKIVNTEDK